MVRKDLSISIDAVMPSPSGSKRMTFPDVPEDVAALHWNDPNYDIYSLPSPTASTNDTLELEAKSARSSAGYSISEFDGESQIGSSRPDFSQSNLKAEEDYDE